jgi:hypothetical protein
MITTTVARLSVLVGSSVKVGGLPPRRQEHQAKEDKQKYCAKGLQSIAFCFVQFLAELYSLFVCLLALHASGGCSHLLRATPWLVY